MAPAVERIPEIPNLKLGEGPHWDIETQSLYFVDILGKSIHKFNPSTGQHTKATLEKAVSVIIPVKDKRDQFLVTLERELCIITWDGRSEKVSSIEKIDEVDEGTNNRINDGKCDPRGRLWFGTMDNGEYVKPSCGSLFSINNGKIATHFTNVGVSNGLAWNKQLKQFYYIDSFARSVDAFDYNIENGTISNRKSIFTLNENDAKEVLDGMTIDVDGNLWVAVFNGYRVVKIDPRKPETVIQIIKFPAKQITSVAWGGIDLNILYVTSGSFTGGNFVIPGEELPPPNHGATFRVTGLGTRGLSADSFVL